MSDDGKQQADRPSDGTHPRSLLAVALAFAIGLAIIISQCSASEWSSGRINASRACGVEGKPPISLGRSIVAICAARERLPLQHMTFDLCHPQTTIPRVLYTPDDSTEELMFFSEMMVRFQEVDEFTAKGAGYVPDYGDLAVSGQAQVFVVDTGAHGEFVSSIAASILNTDYATVTVKSADAKAALSAEGLADTGLEAELAQAGVVYVSMDSGTDVDGHFVTESELVQVLDALHTSDAIRKETMVLNLSLGAYSCGEPPQELERAISRLVEHGAKFVAAAGNDETDESPYPAGFAVGLPGDPVAAAGYSVGSESADDPLTRSCFSNHGDWVEYWYPGEKVVANQGDQTGTWSGTSFSAPQVAALLAGGRDLESLDDAAHQSLNDPDLPMFSVVIKTDGGFETETETFCGPDGPYPPPGYVRDA